MITITKEGSNIVIDGFKGKSNIIESISDFRGARVSDDGTKFSLFIAEINIEDELLSNVTIGGTTPTNAATFRTALATVFPSAAPATALPTETVATYAAMTTSITSDPTTKRDFFVTADETNGGVKASYRYDGSKLIQLNIIIDSPNLFDKSLVQAGYAINAGAGGVTSAFAGFGLIEHIAVKPSTQYTIWGYGTSITNLCVRYETSAFAMISFVVISSNVFTFTTPSNCTFLSFTVYRDSQTTAVDTVMMQEGTKTSYVPYGQSILKIGNRTFVSGSTTTIAKSTSGKRFLIFGDSITDLNFNANNWPAIAATKLEWGYVKNVALSGATIKDTVGYTGNQILSGQITSAIASDPSNIDVIVIAIGTNDGTTNLGDYTTAMSKATLNDLNRVSSTYEALRWALWTIKNQWPTAVCFIATPLQRADVTNAAIAPLDTCIKDMAAEYGCIVMDARKESGITRQNETYGSAGVYLSDGRHPNSVGQLMQAKYFSSKILSRYIP
jgi:lysophospholipase L1-like esterase